MCWPTGKRSRLAARSICRKPERREAVSPQVTPPHLDKHRGGSRLPPRRSPPPYQRPIHAEIGFGAV